jgi:hypothetical protein
MLPPVDFGQAAAIADLFCEDGTWDGVDLQLNGRDEIRGWFVKREGVVRRVSRHICTNVAIDMVSPYEAHSLCYLINDRREGDLSPRVPELLGVVQQRHLAVVGHSPITH